MFSYNCVVTRNYITRKTTSCSKDLRDFSSFDKMLVHLKLQTRFVLPGLISLIRSFQKNRLELNEFEPVKYNPSSIHTCKMVWCWHPYTSTYLQKDLQYMYHYKPVKRFSTCIPVPQHQLGVFRQLGEGAGQGGVRREGADRGETHRGWGEG